MPICLSNPGRIMQLILRNAAVEDVIVLDILGPDGGEQGIHLLAGSWDDLWHAPITQVRESHAYQEGATLADFPRKEERVCAIKLGTIGRSTRAWEEIDSLLWRVLGAEWDCYLRVHSEISEPRELRVRLESAPKPLTQIDPGRTKALAWDVRLLAVDPFWYAPDISYAIRRSEMVEVNAGTGLPQPGSGIWQGTVPMHNPADTDCWPEFACSTITADAVVWLPDALTGRTVRTPTVGVFEPGQEFLVRTHPLVEQLLVRDDSQKWAEMNGVFFEAPIPKSTGAPVQVPIRVQGGSADLEIRAWYRQRHTRFFGGEAA